jgi:16S rRNA processing protein RimM
VSEFSAPPERVSAGTAGKAHGLDGSFYVVGAVPSLLAKGLELFVGAESEPRTIERRSGTDEKPIIRLSGSDNRTAAESFRGLPLQASNAGAAELEGDEYWAHQLVGCSVTAQADQRVLGEVAELLGLPSCEVLVVKGGPVGELLVPMVKDAIVTIDPEGRSIVVDAEFLALDDA